MLYAIAATLERNQHITLAHVNPECYNSVPLHANDGQPLALPPGTPLINPYAAPFNGSFIVLLDSEFQQHAGSNRIDEFVSLLRHAGFLIKQLIISKQIRVLIKKMINNLIALHHYHVIDTGKSY